MQGEFPRLLSNSIAFLIDTRQWHSQKIVVVGVAAAHDGDVFGNTLASLQASHQCTHCRRIVVAENPVGPRVEAQQLPCRRVTYAMRGLMHVLFHHEIFLVER